MTKQTEALKLALEALEMWCPMTATYLNTRDEAITAIREALALVNEVDQEQPAQQEPVAWAFLNGQYAHIVWGKQRPDDEIHTIPLYTSPPTLSLAQRQARSADTWVGLTEPEINDCYESIMFDQNIEPSRMGVYLEIEAKLKEKNT